MDNGRNIRIPVHMYVLIEKYQRALIQLQQKYNRIPTQEEIAKYLDIDTEKLAEIIDHQYDTLSLNELVGDKDDTEIESFIPSPEDTPDIVTAKKMLSDELRDLLERCTKNEKELDVMLLRYGFTGRKYTLEEIGQKYNLTRERIRQIEAKVVRKLKTPKYRNMLLGISQTNNIFVPNTQEQSTNRQESEIISITQVQKPSTYTNSVNQTSPKPLDGILEIFLKEGYNRNEILTILSYLGQEDKKIIDLTNGPDLDNPKVSEKITKKVCDDYKWITIPRIRTMLKSVYGLPAANRDIQNSNENESKDSPIKLIESLPHSDEEDKKTKKEKEIDIMSEEIKTKGKPKKSIIQKFIEKGYTKEQIETVIQELSDKHKEGIKIMDGEDLEHPVKNPKATKQDSQLYYGTILPTIERKLKSKFGSKEEIPKEQKRKPRKQKGTVVKGETSSDAPPVATVKEDITLTSAPEVPSQKETITKEEYIRILGLLKTPSFKELMTELNPKSAIIIALRLGYVDGKYFSSESIANFLGIEESEVRETTIEILNLYKNSLNGFIDTAVAYDKSAPSRKLVPEEPK